MTRSYRYSYRLRINPETRPALSQMVGELGFLNDVPGAKYGEPSPARFLDSLAAAYRADPGRVLAALRSAGVTGPGLREGL